MRWLRAVTVTLLSALAAAVVLAVATGSVSSVVTHGTSMEPGFHGGDLAIIKAADHYRVGEVVAYHSDRLDTTVMHRIVDIDGGRHTFQGDNNSWLDPERPTQDKVIGKLFLRVPQGGVWLDRLTSPAMLGLLAFGLLATGGSVAQNRRRNRKRLMSQHAHRTRPSGSLGTLPPYLATLAALAALLTVLGAGLAAFAWSGSTTQTVSEETSSEQTVTFSYTAQVPRTAAYDDTTVHSPQPVFRALTDSVDVHYDYQGQPGSVRVLAELSATSGWHSTVPLTARTDFDGETYEGTASLDLTAFEKRAQEAAQVIGVPADQVTVTVRAQFHTEDTGTFAAELPLTLTATQLALLDASAMTVTNTASSPATITAPRTLDVLGHQISVATARTISVLLLVLALLTAVTLAGLARIGAPDSEGAAIRRRYAGLLVEVEPMSTPTGRPVVDVGEIATLVKVAERYGLLVLHWSRTSIETFVVQDESATYRYRTPAGPADVVARREETHV